MHLNQLRGAHLCSMTMSVALRINVSVIMGEHCLISHTFGVIIFVFSKSLDTINRRSVRYDYDTFGSLSGAVYGDGSRQWRNPDAMGNVYDSPDRTDRSYGRGGQLREDRKWRYYYDSHGNLVLKTMRRSGPSLETGMRDEFLAWQSGDYAYTWQGNGMLRSVTRPDGKTVTFKYDALGRRIEKVFDGRVYRYLWDGDVILHEWTMPSMTVRTRLLPSWRGHARQARTS